MSADANQSVENLLLLCLYHAALIDATPNQFPADLLRRWKTEQVAAADLVVERWFLSDDEVSEALGLTDIKAAIDAVAAVVPFNPRMRSRFESWQRAARTSAARRLARLTPFVRRSDRDAVVTWMSIDAPELPVVPPSEVRVLIGPLGAGKSELATRWWEEGLHSSGTTEDSEIGAFFTAREVVRLEKAIIDEIGGDPTRACRVVIDGLDDVAPDRAADLLTQARVVTQTWPEVSVLATARPGITVTDDERIEIAPWSITRGGSLLRAVMGADFYWPHWNTETLDLLTAPLTTLLLIGRLQAGHVSSTSRAQLLSGIAEAVINVRQTPVSEGQPLTISQVGPVLSTLTAGEQVRVYRNGTPITSDPAALKFTAHDEIVVWLGSASQQPQIPTSYAFPDGL